MIEKRNRRIDRSCLPVQAYLHRDIPSPPFFRWIAAFPHDLCLLQMTLFRDLDDPLGPRLLEKREQIPTILAFTIVSTASNRRSGGWRIVGAFNEGRRRTTRPRFPRDTSSSGLLSPCLEGTAEQHPDLFYLLLFQIIP